MPLGDHPFNRALGAVYGDIEANLRQHRIRLEDQVRNGPAPNGSMPWHLESPDWAYYMAVDLPHYPFRRAEILAIIVRRLNEARRALPQAEYDITLGDRPFAWDEAKGFQPPPE